MSGALMTAAERRHRSRARSHGELAREAIELARPWNRAGERYIAEAYVYACRAFHHAALSLRARPRRKQQER